MLSIEDPTRQITPVLFQTRAGNRHPAGDVRQVRTQVDATSIDLLIVQSLHGMAKNTSIRHKYLLPALCRLVRGCSSRLPLRADPLIKIGSALHDDHESHVRMLQAAKFSTLAA